MNTIIVYGNPIDGFRYVGPFESRDAALHYCEDDGGDWWLTTLEPPPEEFQEKAA
jgi:hypothetical protein